MEFRDTRRTCVIVASGPSAGLVPIDLARGLPTLAVNDGYRIAPWADIIYAADSRWWDIHIRAVKPAEGEKVTCCAESAKKHGIGHVEYERKPGLSTTPGVIRTGGALGNSGAQGINLAYIRWKPGRILLVGFDMAAQGHFFGPHPGPLNRISPWPAMRAEMAAMASDLADLGVDVINCSPRTAIGYWTKGDLRECLAECLPLTA